MIYDSNRTSGIVRRLVKLGNNLQAMMVVACGLSMGSLTGILGALVFSSAWVFFFLVGLLVGVAVGLLLGAFMVLTLEWMAQIMIIQSNQLDNDPH